MSVFQTLVSDTRKKAHEAQNQVPPTLHVQGLAYRKIQAAPEVLAVRPTPTRSSSLIGGEVLCRETIDSALSRYFQGELGCEIVFDHCYPLMVLQYPADGLQVTVIYLVQINSEGNEILRLAGNSPGKIQRATWFSMLTLPKESEFNFGFGQYFIYRKALQVLADRR